MVTNMFYDSWFARVEIQRNLKMHETLTSLWLTKGGWKYSCLPSPLPIARPIHRMDTQRSNGRLAFLQRRGNMSNSSPFIKGGSHKYCLPFVRACPEQSEGRAHFFRWKSTASALLGKACPTLHISSSFSKFTICANISSEYVIHSRNLHAWSLKGSSESFR